MMFSPFRYAYQLIRMPPLPAYTLMPFRFYRHALAIYDFARRKERVKAAIASCCLRCFLPIRQLLMLSRFPLLDAATPPLFAAARLTPWH